MFILFNFFFSSGANQADFYEQVPIIIRELLQRLNDSSQEVLKSTNLALNALTTFVPAEELVIHVGFIRNLIASMVSDARYRKGGVGDGEFLLPGLNQPKGKLISCRKSDILALLENDDMFIISRHSIASIRIWGFRLVFRIQHFED